MFSRLTAHERHVPNLVIAQRVIEKMVSAAQRFVEDETGEAMVGLLVPGTHTGVPTLYVLDTISPDDSAVRQIHTFQQGDERQDEQIWWLQENWRVWREQRKATTTQSDRWDVPLRYLGDWHKQPGFMIQPSGGDLRTALNWIDDPDNHMTFLLAPIITLDHPPTTVAAGSSANFLTVAQGDGYNARIDFWYIDQQQRMFMPVMPAVYPDNRLPKLPGIPWHLASEDRSATEFAQMTGDGLATSIVLWNADGEMPLEVCLMAARAGSDHVLLLATPWDYPARPATARVAPYAQFGADDVYDVFARLWATSKPVADPPGWRWTPEQYLIDYVHAIEASLDSKREGTKMPDAPTGAAASQEVRDELGQS